MPIPNKVKNWLMAIAGLLALVLAIALIIAVTCGIVFAVVTAISAGWNAGDALIESFIWRGGYIGG